MKSSGIVFDVQRFAVHDGPGIRSTVFIKGCSCGCAWCHNPESHASRGQIEFYPSHCIGCGACFKACPEKAHRLEGTVHVIDREFCKGCGLCAEGCNTAALVLKGKELTVAGVLDLVMADKAYYKESGGGITLSGGEPVMQNFFAGELLSAFKKEGLHTALQTAGNYPYSMLEPLLPDLDMVMYDIKGYTRRIYDEFIHGDRDTIFNNLKQLSRDFHGLLAVRTPVICPINDSKDEIGLIVQLLSELPKLDYYQLLPYHGLGKAKYDALDVQFPGGFSTPPPEKMEELERLASRFVPVFNQDKGMLNFGR